MNEPSSFCNYPCTDPFQQAIEGGYPPNRTSPVPNPNAPILGQSSTRKRAYHGAGENLEIPPYMIQNAAGPALGAKTADVSSLSGSVYAGLT
jgi:alpha-glucosidase